MNPIGAGSRPRRGGLCTGIGGSAPTNSPRRGASPLTCTCSKARRPVARRRRRNGLEPRRLSARLAAAWDRQDWEEVLAILRLGTEFLTPDQVALLRFLGWYELGHDDAALLFLEHASRLSPQNPHYRLMILHFQRMRALRSEMEALGSAMETQLTTLKPLLAELGLPIPIGAAWVLLKELLTRLRDPTDDPILKLEDARIRESLSRAS